MVYRKSMEVRPDFFWLEKQYTLIVYTSVVRDLNCVFFVS